MTTPQRDGGLGTLVPPELRELLRGHALVLQRPVWGRLHGRHVSARTGVGLEFRDHRQYVPGDDPRMLDWRAVARRDRLVLRQTQAEDELNLFLAVDQSGGMSYGEGTQDKRVVANALAGALASLAVRQGDRVGLIVGRDGEFDASLLRPTSGRERLTAIAHVLQRDPPAGRCPWTQMVQAIVPRMPRRSMLVMVSDFLDPAAGESDHAEQDLYRGLAQLRARGHDVVLVQTLHRDELVFPWDERRLHQFEDLRGVRTRVEGPGMRLRDGYLAALSDHLEHLERTCERDGLFLTRVITDEPLSTAFVALLGRLAGAAATEARP